MPVIFSIANQPETEQPNVLPNANLAELQDGMQVDILANSQVVRQAVKRFFELESDWPGQSSLAGRFGLAVRVMETAAPCQKSARNHIKSEGKVYLSDKTYD